MKRFVAVLNEHLIERYFGYRARYVARVRELAPNRARLAIVSELARLGFALVGSTLCALLFWVLAADALARPGPQRDWAAVFGLLALGASGFALAACWGIRSAAAALANEGRAAPH
ncbi:MAG: hypothetical protein ACREM2_00900 [Vulcanimicrobiaceae bacterium]